MNGCLRERQNEIYLERYFQRDAQRDDLLI